MELHLDIQRTFRNRKTGQFLKGHVPHNKGKKWEDYLDMRKAKRIKKNLQRCGNPNIGGQNKIQVIGIKDNKIVGVFESATLVSKLLEIQRRNISYCCQGKRKRAGGIYWFYESNFIEWNKMIIND